MGREFRAVKFLRSGRGPFRKVEEPNTFKDALDALNGQFHNLIVMVSTVFLFLGATGFLGYRIQKSSIDELKAEFQQELNEAIGEIKGISTVSAVWVEGTDEGRIYGGVSIKKKQDSDDLRVSVEHNYIVSVEGKGVANFHGAYVRMNQEMLNIISKYHSKYSSKIVDLEYGGKSFYEEEQRAIVPGFSRYFSYSIRLDVSGCEEALLFVKELVQSEDISVFVKPVVSNLEVGGRDTGMQIPVKYYDSATDGLECAEL